MSSMRRITLLALVAVVVLAAAAATTAVADTQTCSASSDNPLTNVNFTESSAQACVTTRCQATIGITPTTFTGGYCNGDATTEADVACDTLYPAYNEYYACLYRSIRATDTAALSSVKSEVNMFFNTPGFPYHLSVLGCYACNNFRETVYPAITTTCTSWTCSSISSQNPASLWYGVPGHGYNHQLCGTGCIAAMMLTIPFAIMSAFMFIACGCCWPTPSLKTTYTEVHREEEAEKHRVRSDDEDDEENHEREPVEGVDNTIAHEPVMADDARNHPEEASNPEEYVNLR